MPAPTCPPVFGRLRSCAGRLVLAAGFTAALVGLAPVAQAQTPVRFTLDWRFEGPAALFLMGREGRGWWDRGTCCSSSSSRLCC